MRDFPSAIILYQGGSAGDFIKALCNSQITGIDLLKMKGSRVALDNWSFKDTPDYNGVYVIENTHRLDIIEAWPESDWYWISVPYQSCSIVAKWLATKTDCVDFQEFRVKHVGWINGLERQNGPIDSWKDFINIETQTIHGWMHAMHEYTKDKPFKIIPFMDIIDRDACVSIIETITKQSLAYPELYLRQHEMWSSLNQCFIRDLLQPFEHS